MSNSLPVIYEILDRRLQSFSFEPATPGSAGYDLRACIDTPVTIQPNKVLLISTGIRLEMSSPNMAGLIMPRSSMGHKRGLILGNSTGVIDSDYHGVLMVSLWNRSETFQFIEPLERIAQLMFVPLLPVNMLQGFVGVADSLRGEGGFGSTGQH